MIGINCERISIISPTGQDIRSDSKGDGHFEAPRGFRIHYGLDFLGDPGQQVVQPLSELALIRRIAYPYSDTKDYAGVELVTDHFIAHMFYFEPDRALLGKYVKQGEAIGIMQDISQRYGRKMHPHIHLAIYIDPEVLL